MHLLHGVFRRLWSAALPGVGTGGTPGTAPAAFPLVLDIIRGGAPLVAGLTLPLSGRGRSLRGG